MRIKSRALSLLFKAFIVVVGGIALLDQIGLFEGSFKIRFFFYFTNLSNVLAVAYFIGALLQGIAHPNRGAVWAPAFKYAAMMGVTVTFLISHFMLGGGFMLPDGSVNYAVFILHYIVPIACILDWLLFDKKGMMSLVGPFKWMVFPLLYLGYVMIMVNVLGIPMNGFGTGRYPYPFIDVDANGATEVATTVVVLVLAFAVLGYIYVIIDRLLARLGSKKPTTPELEEQPQPPTAAQ